MKTSRSKKAPPRVAGRVLPADACPSCGTIMTERRSALKLPVNGEEVSVPSAVHEVLTWP